jgi:hypothetical protein
MRRNILVATLAMAALCACTSPPYRQLPNDKTARLRFVYFDKPEICISGQAFSLTPDGNGDVRVAAGRPVHLLGRYRRDLGHCSPAVKFVPQAGQAYDVVNDVRAEQCIASVMRHDASAQYGLRVEPSLNASEVCRR